MNCLFCSTINRHHCRCHLQLQLVTALVVDHISCKAKGAILLANKINNFYAAHHITRQLEF